MPQQFLKDPSDSLDYRIDWSEWLAESSPADTIASSSWTADDGITIGNGASPVVTSTNTSSTATIWLSAGTVGRTYHVTNRITTAGGRTAERSIYVTIVQK